MGRLIIIPHTCDFGFCLPDDVAHSSLFCSLVIGLFGLVGLAGVILGPFTGRFMDRIAPWYGVMMSTILLFAFQAIQTGAGAIHIAAVIVGCIGLDAFRQVQIVSMVMMIFRYVFASLSARTERSYMPPLALEWRLYRA